MEGFVWKEDNASSIKSNSLLANTIRVHADIKGKFRLRSHKVQLLKQQVVLNIQLQLPISRENKISYADTFKEMKAYITSFIVCLLKMFTITLF